MKLKLKKLFAHTVTVFKIAIYLLIFVLNGTNKTLSQSIKNKNMHQTTSSKPAIWPTTYHTIKVKGLNIFYREAGNPEKPAILLLHGFPSSSHMYRNLIEDLSSEYHLIAPDYPGFGLSSSPSIKDFSYTFDHLSEIMESFIDTLKLTHFSLYMQDYGGPVGFRIISKRPELVQALIIQNANTYTDGLGADVQKIGALQAAGDVKGLDKAINYMISLEGIKEQYVFGSIHPENISPDAYLMDHFFLENEEKKEIQKVLFKNYETNFPKYLEWQQYLKKYQPPTIITWGKNDKIFTGPGALAYKKDLKNVEVHLFDGGHFLLEEYHQEIARLINNFLKKNLHSLAN